MPRDPGFPGARGPRGTRGCLLNPWTASSPGERDSHPQTHPEYPHGRRAAPFTTRRPAGGTSAASPPVKPPHRGTRPTGRGTRRSTARTGRRRPPVMRPQDGPGNRRRRDRCRDRRAGAAREWSGRAPRRRRTPTSPPASAAGGRVAASWRPAAHRPDHRRGVRVGRPVRPAPNAHDGCARHPPCAPRPPAPPERRRGVGLQRLIGDTPRNPVDLNRLAQQARSRTRGAHGASRDGRRPPRERGEGLWRHVAR